MSQKVNLLLILGCVSAVKPKTASDSVTISCASVSWH